MVVKLYLGVEGVLLHRTNRLNRKARGFEAVPHALEFLSWAHLRFECYWLTSLDRGGGNNRIKRAFRIALNLPSLPGELEFLFEVVNPTVWDMTKVEAIDLDSNFFWIENDPDQESLAVLKRRGLENRLMICREPNDFWKFACLLEPLSDLPEEW